MQPDVPPTPATPDPWPYEHLMQPPVVRQAGTTLFHQGEAPGCVQLIQEGVAQLTHLNGNGRRLVLGHRGPGWILGAGPAALHGAHPATGEAITVMTIRVMGVLVFEGLCERAPDANAWLVRMLAREAGQYRDAVLLASLSVPQRLLKFVIALSEGCPLVRHRDGSVQIRLTLRRQDLAESIGAERETVSRAVGALERSGIVHFGARHIFIPPASPLQRELA